MKMWGKILVATVIGCGLYTVVYARRLNKTKTELLVIPKVILHSLTLAGITLRVDVTFKNYTAGNIKLRFPFITLLYKGTVIGSSRISNDEREIPAYGELTIEKIMVDIPLGSVFSVVTTLLKSLNSKESVTLTVKTKTTVNLGVGSIGVEDKQDLPLIAGTTDKK